MNKKVAVIGLGPAGAYAARAASDAGFEVDVYTFGDSRPAPGAFWLYWLPDKLAKSHKAENIYVAGKGSSSRYSQLQWGNDWDKVPSNSFPAKPYWAKGYNFTEVFDSLLPIRCDVKQMARPLSDTDILELSKWYDKVFQTFPRKEHIESQPAKIPYVVAVCNAVGDDPNNVVVYNGTGEGIVVREAILFGKRYLEFPKGMSETDVWREHELDTQYWKYFILKDLDPSTIPVEQSIKDPVQLVGRWAEWNSKRLSHEVYKIVQDTLEVLK